MAAQLVAVLQLDGRQSQGDVFEEWSVCDRIDFNYLDEGRIANERSDWHVDMKIENHDFNGVVE